MSGLGAAADTSATDEARRPGWHVHRAGLVLGLTAIYVVAGKLGLTFASLQESASPVWPPAGIALAGALLLGRVAYPAILVGAFIVNVTTSGAAFMSLAIALGNALEAATGAYLVARLANGPAAFDRARDIFTLATAAGVVSTAISATVGVTALAVAGRAPWADYGSIWFTWWLGDAAGVLLVTAPILLWNRERGWGRLRQAPLEAAALLAAAMITALAVFAGVGAFGVRHLPVAFVILPLLLWAAFRFGARETSTLLALVGAIAVAGTIAGRGPFAPFQTNVSLVLLQSFLATCAITALPIAALVSERRRVERRLREAEEQVRLALATAGTGIWEWTLRTGEVRWSPTLEAIHGLAPGRFAGTVEAFQADVHPDDRALLQESIERALESGSHRVEYRIVRPDGAVRWVEGRGETFYDADRRPARMVGMCMDVTERVRAEQERARLLGLEQAARRRAEEMERRVGFLGEIARSISSSLDLSTVLQRIAQGAQALCGSDTAAIFLREPHGEALAPRFRVGPWLEVYDHLRIRPGDGPAGQVLSTGRPLRTVRHGGDGDAARPAGETEPGALMVVPIAIGTEIAGLLYIGNRAPRPFTDEDEAICVRLAEQAAVAVKNARLFAAEETARADAEQASRAKDEFLAMLGHELRNPLSAISNAVHVVERGGAGAATAAREVIARQVRHLGRLVDDLLDVSRATRGKIELHPEVLDLGAAVERSLATFAATGATARHRVVVRAEGVLVHADPVRIEQVATNLIENAVKYTPEGGEIAVTVRRQGGSALFEVSDTGTGIAPDLLPRVFDLFVQGDRTLARTSGGLGIGLTLVRRLVELHGGTISATSDGPGRGSRFTVCLPAVAPTAAIAEGAGGLARPRAGDL